MVSATSSRAVVGAGESFIGEAYETGVIRTLDSAGARNGGGPGQRRTPRGSQPRARDDLRRFEPRRPSSAREVIDVLGDLHLELNNVANEYAIYVAMHPDKQVRDAAEALQREVSELSQQSAADLVRDFLGRPYDLRAFKAWLAPRREGSA